MKRFFGMMPSIEIKKQQTFIDDNDFHITIEAGEKGWTIIYADNSTEYKNNIDTTENNFNEALAILKSNFNIK